jgi:hypothetical protein
VRLRQPAERVGIGLARSPLAVLVHLSDGTAQRATLPDRLPELLRQLAQPVLARQIPARRRDLMPQHLGNREMLEKRHDIGEGLVKRQHVGIAGLIEAAVHAVEQRMRDLVRDDVVRETREHRQPRCGRAFRDRREVAERSAFLSGL